jgi:hypothetical protein
MNLTAKKTLYLQSATWVLHVFFAGKLGLLEEDIQKNIRVHIELAD